MTDHNHRIGHVDRQTMDDAEFARLNAPSNWISYAKAMQRAAEALKERMDVNERNFEEALHAELFKHGASGAFVSTGESIGEPWLVQHGRDYGPLLLTAGLAIEAALKAIRILRDPQCVAQGKSQLGHNQVRIAKDAGILLLESEHCLCNLLSDFVEFAGRYPSTVNAKNSHSGIMVGDDFFPEFQNFFNRLKNIYEAESGNQA